MHTPVSAILYKSNSLRSTETAYDSDALHIAYYLCTSSTVCAAHLYALQADVRHEC
jgi:hypothetical protein